MFLVDDPSNYRACVAWMLSLSGVQVKTIDRLYLYFDDLTVLDI